MPIALPDRTELGLVVFRLLFWLCALVTLYWEIQLLAWIGERLSASGALRYAQVVIREFLAF